MSEQEDGGISQGPERTVGRPANISQDSALGFPGGTVKPFMIINLIALNKNIQAFPGLLTQFW